MEFNYAVYVDVKRQWTRTILTRVVRETHEMRTSDTHTHTPKSVMATTNDGCQIRVIVAERVCGQATANGKSTLLPLVLNCV